MDYLINLKPIVILHLLIFLFAYLLKFKINLIFKFFLFFNKNIIYKEIENVMKIFKKIY